MGPVGAGDDDRQESEPTARRALFGPLMRSAARRHLEVLCADLEPGPTVIVRRGDCTLMLELERRNPSRPCWERTSRFNICARPLHAGSRRNLQSGERALALEVIELLGEGERRLPSFERPVTSGRAAVREVRGRQVLVAEGAGQYYINPYVGCMIGCSFCWVAERADLSRELEGLPSIPWGRWVDVKVDAARVLRREIRDLAPGSVRMSPVVTDPYQPLERRYRVTRSCLEVLLDGGFSPVILTRAARVLDDLRLLARFERVAVGLSIPTDDDRVRAQFEPGADPIGDRLAALRALKEAGITTFAVVQPALPMNVDALVAKVAPNVSAIRIDRMYSTDRMDSLRDPAAAMGDAAVEDRLEALRAGFRARGVAIDGLDDMSGLLESDRGAA